METLLVPNKLITEIYWLLYVTGSIVFVLKGNQQTGFSFEGLATCVSSITTSGHIPVRIAKVLKEGATLPGSSDNLLEGQVVLWPQNMVVLYKAPSAGLEKTSCTSNLKGIICLSFDM